MGIYYHHPGVPYTTPTMFERCEIHEIAIFALAAVLRAQILELPRSSSVD